jgi:6-phosphogluconate dehydrogenase
VREIEADVAVIGLARLGRDLTLRLADHGYAVVVHNRTVEKVEDFLSGPAAGRRNVTGAGSVEQMLGQLSPPRKVMLTITAGRAPDEVIEQLLPHLEPGDAVVDAGNSHFADTERRTKQLDNLGVLFIGAGIARGEARAGHGPSIMVGGNPDAWQLVKEMLQSIAASSSDGDPYCGWVGEGGAGHFVKMVHNGIEYADMQLVCEAYQLLGEGLGLTARDIHRVFTDWNGGELESYLLGITVDILGFEAEDGTPLLEKILDVAEQKGSGSGAMVSSLELRVPATLIGQAVYARSLSAMKDERVAAATLLRGPDARLEDERDTFVDDLRLALLASRVVSHAQAHTLLCRASDEHGWALDYGTIAALWQGGGIIRSALLAEIRRVLAENPASRSLMLDRHFRAAIDRCQASWRQVVATAAKRGLPTPTISAALAFYDGYRRERLPANLLQAQRDYVAAHGYERADREGGLRFHTDWLDGASRSS